jgi:hypothetical protein
MTEKTMILPCEAGCEILKLSKYDLDNDPEPYVLEVYFSAFYEKQNNLFTLLWQRIKGACFMLMGKEFFLYDLVISKEKFKEFSEFVNSIK